MPRTEARLLFDVQDTKDIVVGLDIIHVRAGALLVGVDDDFAPVFRDSAFGARGGSAWRRCAARGDGCCSVGFLRRGGGCRQRCMESRLGLKVWLWLEGPDIDDRAGDSLATAYRTANRHDVSIRLPLTQTCVDKWIPRPLFHASRIPDPADWLVEHGSALRSHTPLDKGLLRGDVRTRA